MHRDVVIVGAGGHARVCADIVLALGGRLLGFCAKSRYAGELIGGMPIIAASLGDLQRTSPSHRCVIIALGDNQRRKAEFEEAKHFGYELPCLIHPSAIISPSATIDEGTVIMPGVIVNANARVGRYCILNTACSIDHDNVLEDGVQIAPGVRAAGNVHFGAMAFIGIGATLIPGVVVGTAAIVGAGAVVTKNVPPGVLAVGVPARVIRPARSSVT